MTSPAPSSAPPQLALRLASFYIAQFVVVGIYIPFWPVWLNAQGFSAPEIGWLIGIGLWTKLLTNSVITHFADRYSPRLLMILLAWSSIPVMATFSIIETFPAAIGLTILFSALFSGQFPLSESLTLTATRQHNLDYGHIRLWGSIAFILTVLPGGWLISTLGSSVILWLLVGGLCGLGMACLRLPTLPSDASGKNPANPLRQTLAMPKLTLFIIYASIIQASHAAYFSFSTLHWQKTGYPDWIIGGLWALGVIAEIVFFAFGKRLIARYGACFFLILAAVASLIRWIGLAEISSLPGLILLQSLHALTFGATHLATMQFIQDHAPQGSMASTQGVYSSLAMGAFMGIATITAGWLYAWQAPTTFLAMAGLAAIATIGILRFLRD